MSESECAKAVGELFTKLLMSECKRNQIPVISPSCLEVHMSEAFVQIYQESTPKAFGFIHLPTDTLYVTILHQQKSYQFQTTLLNKNEC